MSTATTHRRPKYRWFQLHNGNVREQYQMSTATTHRRPKYRWFQSSRQHWRWSWCRIHLSTAVTDSSRPAGHWMATEERPCWPPGHELPLQVPSSPKTTEQTTEKGWTSHQTHYRSYWEQVFTGQMTQPTVSKHWRKIDPKDQASIPSSPPHRATTTQYEMSKTHKIHTDKC